jgi:hypothetical protein
VLEEPREPRVRGLRQPEHRGVGPRRHPDQVRLWRVWERLFPPATVAIAIGTEYETQCRQLCYGPYPSWTQVQERLAELRPVL